MRYIGYILLFILSAEVACTKKATTSANLSPGKKEEKLIQFESYFNDGMKYYLLGHYNDAQALFEKALALEPESHATLHMLSKIAIQKNELNKAIQYAGKALKIDPKNKHYYLTLAEAYQKNVNINEAIKVYKKLIAEIPKSEEYYYNLADLYIYNNQFDDALKIYEKIQDLMGMSLELTRQKQQLYLRLNKTEKALSEGEAYIKAFPDDLDGKMSQAEVLFNNRYEQQAIQLLHEVLKTDSDNIKAHLMLADIYERRGENEKSIQELEIVFTNPLADLDMKLKIVDDKIRSRNAEKESHILLRLCEQIIKAHPNESKPHLYLADIHLLRGDKENAWKELIVAKKNEPNNYNLWIQLIELDSELKKTDSTLVHTDQALELFPNQAMIYVHKGLACIQKKRYQDAVDALEEAKKLSSSDPNLNNYINILLGDAYHYNKQYTKSDQAYEEALKYDKNNDHVLNNYSYFLALRKEKLEYAKSMSEKLIKKHPNEPTYLDTYAWVLYMLKDYENAKKYLEMAVKNSNNGTIVEHYGDVLYQLGDKENAIIQWKKAKLLGDTSELIDKKIADGKLYE
ncbi:MAG: tetratricopeptide repeat protein [Cytophagaceae bacterium]|nr:tetratricopeptide repeat protein [Cytophagaceae bacterium]MDW8456341.1 tetratricopeptide repeat protein [Cytophagaceae bacterium]